MDSNSISLFSLAIALLAFWLSYRNRLENLRNQEFSNYVNTKAKFGECDLLLSVAEQSFREFWRLAHEHAKIRVPDFDEILERMKQARAAINLHQDELEAKKNDKEAVNKYYLTALDIETNLISLSTSLRENLRNLEKSIEATDLSQPERIAFLRQAIAHIKQWEAF